MPDGRARNVGGRPRSKNYLKNCQRNGRTPLPDSGPPNPEADLIPHGRDDFAHLTKAFFTSVLRNEQQLRTKEPVYDARTLDLANDGILTRHPSRPTPQMLRAASYRTSLVGAIHQVRVDEWSPYADPYGTEQGYEIGHEDPDHELTAKDKKLMKEARNFVRFMGDRLNPGWSNRPDFQQVFPMILRDSLTLDANAYWIVRNRKGRVSEIRYMDPATIFRIDPDKGYKGNKQIAHVQIVNNEVVTEFGPDEVLLFHKNEMSDVFMRGTGFSPTEACIMDLIGLIQALKFNRQKFTNNPPPGLLMIRGNVTQDTLNELNEQWNAMWSQNENNHEIPILATEGDISWQSLGLSDEISFNSMMQWLTTLCLAAHSMDQAELGMKLYAGGLSEPRPDGRITISSLRAKRSELAHMASHWHRILRFIEEYESVRYFFFGIEPDDTDQRLDRNEKRTRSIMTIDEVRIEEGLKTLGEALKETYDLSDEEAEKVRFLGAYIGSAQHLQHAGPFIQSLLPEPPAGAEPGYDEGEDDDELNLDELSEVAEQDSNKAEEPTAGYDRASLPDDPD